ncbi:MAG TPA: class I SAM-dependent methyltransferase [Nitrosospira sp.]|nr:class I SAM-dependent methyltransferase [Nitrosospira sp.]
MLKPLISSFSTDSLNSLIIKDDRTNFENLGTIQDLVCKDMTVTAGFEAQMARDRDLVPASKDREYYHGDHHMDWWKSGLRDLGGMQRAASRAGIDFDTCRYYELGCASGRVVRHVANQTSAEVWCSDINTRHVEWIRMHLSPKINVFNSTAFPSLPLEPASFDMISAFSVFTHIDDLEMMWLLELRRILSKGGLAYITVATEDTWEEYKHGWIKDILTPLADSIKDYKICDDLFSGSLPEEKTVFWWPARNVYNSTVFHSKSYIRREWGRYFDVIDIIRKGHDYQDVVILSRPRCK